MFNEKFGRKNSKGMFKFDSSNCEWITLDRYVEEGGLWKFKVNAVFSYKGKYGDRSCVVTDDYRITVPVHCNKFIDNILIDPLLVDAINKGLCGCEVYSYEDRNGVTRYSISFFDIDENTNLPDPE